MKRFTKFVSLLLVVALMLPLVTLPQSVEADTTADNQYKQSLRDAGFPESYVDGLTALHNQHPNWSFTPYQTGLTWAETLTEDAEMYPSRNLVSSSNVTSWFSNDAAHYNAASNVYNGYDSGTWYQVSKELLEYFMDPRNFFDQQYIFQFEQLSYNSAIQNETGVAAIIQYSFMKNGTVYDANGNTYTYTKAIMDAAIASNASPYYIATKMLFEQSVNGGSALIAGGDQAGKLIWQAYQTDLANGIITAIDGASEAYFIEKYRNLYNYFNIGASGTGYFRIYTNGLEEARTEGWTTPYAAIVGGAQKAAKMYINNKQDTYYLQKFNVTDNGRRYWGQYMQAIQGSHSLAKKSYDAYVSAGALENAFTFSIPVFSDMPENCPQPTENTVANTLLRSLNISGVTGFNFRQYTTAYNLTANSSVNSITIDATAVYSGATIKLNGTTVGTGSFSTTLPTSGLSTAAIEVVSPHGSTVYTLNLANDTSDEPHKVEGTATNGTLHFGNPVAASEYTYVDNVEPGRGCGIYIIPNFGYVLESITRSDGIAVDYTKGYATDLVLGFTMPANDLLFTVVFTPMFNTGSTFSVSQANGKNYINGFTENDTVSNQIAKLVSQSNLSGSSAITVYNADGTAANMSGNFAYGMYLTIDGVSYHSSISINVSTEENTILFNNSSVKITVDGYTQKTNGAYRFYDQLSFTFDKKQQGWYNRYSFTYSSTTYAKGNIYYSNNSTPEVFYLEPGNNKTFSSFIDGFLNWSGFSYVEKIVFSPMNNAVSCDFSLSNISTTYYNIPSSQTVYLENDRYKLGVALFWGGGLNYFEDKMDGDASMTNLFNNHDAGRLVQQSYYGTMSEPYNCATYNGTTWSYNPVQGGDQYGNKSKLIDFEITDTYIYVKSCPKDWAQNNLPTISYMENYYILSENFVRVDNRFLDFSGYDHSPAKHQELPAFYTLSYFDKFTFYDGYSPWTNDTLTEKPDLPFWAGEPSCYFNVKNGNTETWSAWTNSETGYGIGLYTPGTEIFLAGRHTYNGSKDAGDGATNYTAPLKTIELQSFEALEYSYMMTTGNIEEIRSTFTEQRNFTTNGEKEDYRLSANATNGYVTLKKHTDTYVANTVTETDTFTVTFTPKAGYAIASITRSDNIAISYTVGSTGDLIIAGVMPSYDLHFNIIYELIVAGTSGLKTHSYDGYAVVSGFDKNSDVASQLAKLNASITSSSVSSSQLINTSGLASSGTDGFVTNMSFTLNGTTYYTAIMYDTNSDGNVDISDAARTYSHIMGKTKLQNGEFTAADARTDNKINILDLMTILNQI